MKLYLSGPIATEPDFEMLFKKDQQWLEGVGFEVVNPVDTPACTTLTCLETGQAAKPDDSHSWQCYLKYDLAAMLTCDGVAVLDGHLRSKGAMLETYLAMQVAMPIKPVRDWVSLALRDLYADLSKGKLS